MPPSGGSSAPQGAFTNNPGANASVYQPTAQGPADALFQQIAGLTGGGGIPSNPSQTPAAAFYPNASTLTQGLVTNPGFGPTWNILGDSTRLGDAISFYNQGTSGAQQLGMAGSQILNTAFDPQQQLYEDTLNKVQQQSAASAANSGLMGTPYGQSVSDDALSSFNTQWQNQQLQRQIAGGQAAQGLDQGAQSLYGQGLQSFLAPQTAQAQLAGNYATAAGAATNLGNNQYLLPQQVLNDLQSYLGLGQSSSQISGQLGQMGVNENLAQQQLQMQQLGQLGQGFGGLSSLATGGKGLTSLFGGGADLAGGGASLAGLTGGGALASTAADAGAFSAADILPAAALS